MQMIRFNISFLVFFNYYISNHSFNRLYLKFFILNLSLSYFQLKTSQFSYKVNEFKIFNQVKIELIYFYHLSVGI